MPRSPSDRACGFLGLGIVPCRILVYFIADLNVVVARQPLPWAGRVGVAAAKVVFFYDVGREIVISLDDDGFVGFGEDGIFPRGFHDGPSCKITLNWRRSEILRIRRDNVLDTSCENWSAISPWRWPRRRPSRQNACRR